MRTQYFLNEGKSSEVITIDSKKVETLLAMRRQEYTEEGWISRDDLPCPYLISRSIEVLYYDDIEKLVSQGGKYIFVNFLLTGFMKVSKSGGSKIYLSNLEEVVNYIYANNTRFEGYKNAQGAIKYLKKQF